MDIQQRNQNYNHIYDCSVRGFDTSFWDNYLGGMPAMNVGVMEVNAQSIITLNQFLYADVTFHNVVFPTVPTGGDNRIIGFYSPAFDDNGRITFSVEGEEFHVRVRDEAGTSLFDLELEWDALWTGQPIDLRIVWTEMGVRFYIKDATNGEVCKAIYATDGTVNKLKPKEARPLVISNLNADALGFAAVTIKEAHLVS